MLRLRYLLCLRWHLLSRAWKSPHGQASVSSGGGINTTPKAVSFLVLNAERGRVLRLGAAPVIDPGRADAGMAQPLLDAGDVGVVLQRASGGGGAQGVRPHVLAGDADLFHIKNHHIGIHAARRQRARRLTSFWSADASKQRPVRFVPVAAGGQILGHQAQGARVRGNEAQLAALALHPQMRHAPALLVEIFHAQFGEFLAAQRMEQQHGQDGAVPFSLERAGRRCREQRARLRIAQRRRLAFQGVDGRALHAFHRVVQHGVAVAQVIEQGGEGRQLAADGGAGEHLPFQVGAPGQDMGAGNAAKLLRFDNPGEAHEAVQVVLVSAPRLGTVQIGKPLGFGRHVGQAGELGRAQGPACLDGLKR